MNPSTAAPVSDRQTSRTLRHRLVAAGVCVLVAAAVPAGSARAAGTEEDPPTTTIKAAASGNSTASTSTVAGAAKPASSAGDHYEAAKPLIARGDWVPAIAELEQADRLQPDNADVNNLLGYSNRKLGKLDVSLKYYQKALKISPKHRGANEYLGELYLLMKQPAKAKAQLAALSKICGTSCEEYLDLKKAIGAYSTPKTAKKK